MQEIINEIKITLSETFDKRDTVTILRIFKRIRDYCNEPGLNEQDIKDFLNKITEI